jgi:hypothetical protein
VIDGCCLSVKGDGFEQQLIIGGPLHYECHVVPGAADRITGDTGWHPFLGDIVVNVPLMAPGDAALMPPDELLAVHELVDIKLQRL